MTTGRMGTDPATGRVRRSALIVATAASFLTPFLGSAINVALPSIGTEFAMGAVELSWVALAFMLSSAVCLVPFGRVADIVGRKKIFLLGMTLFALSSLGCGLAGSATALIAFRALQGVGGAMIFGTGLAILSSVYPPGERGRVIGLNASAVYVGLSAGPFVGGMLTRHWGWPSVFLITVPIGLAATVIAWRGLQGEWSGTPGGRFDFVGAALYALALMTLMGGLSMLPAAGGVALIAVAVVAGGIFAGWERRAAHPVLDVQLLARNIVFARSNLAAFINYSASFAATFLLSLYLQYLRGLDPGETGLILLTPSVLMAVLSPFAGWLSDRLEPRIVASVGMVLTFAGLVWFCFLRFDTPLPSVIVALVVFGTGFGLFSSPNTNAVMSSVTKAQYGVASATLGTMRLLGQMVSMGVAAAILAFFVGHAPVTPAVRTPFLNALHLGFAIYAVLCFAGVFASLARGNVRPRTTA